VLSLQQIDAYSVWFFVASGLLVTKHTIVVLVWICGAGSQNQLIMEVDYDCQDDVYNSIPPHQLVNKALSPGPRMCFVILLLLVQLLINEVNRYTLLF
jgi:hypothetical protein